MISQFLKYFELSLYNHFIVDQTKWKTELYELCFQRRMIAMPLLSNYIYFTEKQKITNLMITMCYSLNAVRYGTALT